MLKVFVDIDLLMDMAKRYDPITRVLINYIGEWLFSMSTQVIREVFMLNSNIALLEKIDLGKFKSMYEAQKIYLHVGPIQENFVRIGGLFLVTSSTPKPLMKIFFNPRAQALYFSLYRVLGVEEIEHVPRCLVFMMAQIFQCWMTSIFYYVSLF